MQTWLSWIVLDQSLSQIVVKRLVRATVTSKLDWGLLTHLAVGCRPPFLSIWASPLATWVSLQHCNWLSPSEWPKLEIKAEASVSSMAWCQVIYHHLCLIMLVIQASPGVVWEWTTQRYRIMRRRWPGGTSQRLAISALETSKWAKCWLFRFDSGIYTINPAPFFSSLPS